MHAHLFKKNLDAGVGVSTFPGKTLTKVYGSTLLALRGGGWGLISRQKALRNT